jgi:hypothetical protein
MWLRQRKFPTLDSRKHLFGWPPPVGVYEVSPELQRLRTAKSRPVIHKELGYGNGTGVFLRLEKDPRTKPFIKAALAGKNPEQVEGWANLADLQTESRGRPGPNPEDVQRRLKKIAQACTLKACCERAGIDRSTYHKAIKDAEAVDAEAKEKNKVSRAKDDLLDYLASQGKYKKSRLSGLVGDLIIPTDDMRAFRTLASQEKREQRISELQDLLGFDDLFSEWTQPKPYRGKRHRRRHVVTAPVAPAAPVTQGNGEVPSSGERPEGDGTGAKPQKTGKAVPTEAEQPLFDGIQQRQPITGKTLAKKLNRKYNSRFRQHLSGLRAKGLVVNDDDGYRLK